MTIAYNSSNTKSITQSASVTNATVNTNGNVSTGSVILFFVAQAANAVPATPTIKVNGTSVTVYTVPAGLSGATFGGQIFIANTAGLSGTCQATYSTSGASVAVITEFTGINYTGVDFDGASNAMSYGPRGTTLSSSGTWTANSSALTSGGTSYPDLYIAMFVQSASGSMSTGTGFSSIYTGNPEPSLTVLFEYDIVTTNTGYPSNLAATINQGGNLSASGFATYNSPTTPATPAAPTASRSGSTSQAVSLTWTKPWDGNASGSIDNYTNKPASTPAGGAKDGVDSGNTGSGLSTTVTGLTLGDSYTFQVRAHNSQGYSAYSPASNSVVPPNYATSSLSETDRTTDQSPLGRLVNYLRSLQSENIGALLSDSTDRIANFLRNPAAETAAAVDNLTYHLGTVSRIFQETILTSDSPLGKLVQEARSPSPEALQISSSVARLGAHIKSIAPETLSASGSMAQALGKIRSMLPENLSIVDLVDRTYNGTLGSGRIFVETLNTVDATDRLVTYLRTLSETYPDSDFLYGLQTIVRANPENIPTLDSLAQAETYLRPMADLGMLGVDVLLGNQAVQRSLSVTLHVSDLFQRSAVAVFVENLLTTDLTPARLVRYGRLPIETVLDSDLISRIKGILRFVANQTITTSDAPLVSLRFRNIVVNDIMPYLIDVPVNTLGTIIESLPSFSDSAVVQIFHHWFIAASMFLPQTIDTVQRSGVFHRFVTQRAVLLPVATPGPAMGNYSPAVLISPNSQDANGIIYFGSGTNASTGVIVHIKFSKVRGTVPNAVKLYPQNDAASILSLSAINISNAGFDINATVALPSSMTEGTYALQWELV